MVAAVWIVGGPTDDDRADLRFSLRSAHTNVPFISEAWVVGDVPDWFTGVKMPLEPKPSKFENQRASLTAFVNHPAAPAEFWLMNDDMFITEPVESLPIVRNKNRASMWNPDHGQHGSGCWTCAVRATAAWVAEQTGTDPYLYENHSPLLFDTARLRDVVNRYPVHLPFTVGEVYPIAGAAGPGVVVGNAKVKGTDSFDEKMRLPMPYISGNPDSWAGVLGVWAQEVFDSPSRWEK